MCVRILINFCDPLCKPVFKAPIRYEGDENSKLMTSKIYIERG